MAFKLLSNQSMPRQTPLALAQLMALMLIPGGCAILAEDSTGTHSDRQDYGACPSGTHLECLANSSRQDVVCDATTLRCRSGDVSIETKVPQLGAFGRPMHPIARESHFGPGQNDQTPTSDLSARADLLAQIEILNGQLVDEIIDDDAWKKQGTLVYRRLLAEQFVLPLITQMRAEIEATRQDVLGSDVPASYQLDVAKALAAQYQRLKHQDKRLQPLKNISNEAVGKGMSLKDCIAELEGKDGVISLGLPTTETCLRNFMALIPELRQLNDHDLIEPSWLDTLEELVYQLNKRAGLWETQGLVTQASEPIVYAHIQELPITLLSIFETIATPEIEAQNLFPHLRMPVGVSVADGSGGYNEVTLPLGQWAQITVDGSPALTSTDAERLHWFTAAFGVALQQLEDNHGLAISILTKAELEPQDVWQLAFMMEQSGLMELYGGYDSETREPNGFQRLHDFLLTEAANQKFGHEWLMAGLSVGCIVATFLTPPVSFVTAGTCALATAQSVNVAFQLARLATMAETLTYVGINESLVPRHESVQLRHDANIAALLAVIDVVFGAADIVGSARWAKYKVHEIRDGSRARIKSFHVAHGADQVRVLDSSQDLIAALRSLNDTFIVPHVSSVVRLYPTSGGRHRADVLAELFDEPRIGPLMAEAVRHYGMPHFGFRRTSSIGQNFTVFPAGGFVNNGIALVKDGRVLYESLGPSFCFVTDYLLLPRGWDPVPVLREELLHALDAARSGQGTMLLLPGVTKTAQSPLISESALALILQLAERHGIDASILHHSVRHFFTEIRADRVQRAITPAQSPYATSLEPLRVTSDWLLTQLQSVRQNPEGSYADIVAKDIILGLLDSPERAQLLNTLFPPQLWQDITTRAFWGLPD